MTNANVATPSLIVKPYPDLIHQVLPAGTLNLFAGASGAGKTIFLTEWIKRWIDGRTICGKATSCPTGFYYLAADRDWITYAVAFGFAGVPEDRIVKYVLAKDKTINFRQRRPEQALDLLAQCLEKLKPIPGSLTILDPVAPLFIKGDQNKAWDVANSMHALRQLGDHYQTTLLCMANVGKAKTEDGYKRPQDRISGSGAFAAHTDTQIYLIEGDSPGASRTLGWTPRCAAAESWEFQFDLDTHLFVPYTGLQDNGPTEATDRPSQILKLIPPDGIDAGELFEIAEAKFNKAHMTIHRDLETLERNRLIIWVRYGQIRRRKPS